MAGLPQIGTMLNGGIQNGLRVYSQPNGPNTPVFPLPPTTSPPSSWRNTFYLPVYPTVFTSLLAWPCGHWINEPEVYTVGNPDTGGQAAVLCCSVCSYVQYIIEPASDWWVEFFQIYPLGLRNPGAFPTPNLV
jgi:hypothetical protein